MLVQFVTRAVPVLAEIFLWVLLVVFLLSGLVAGWSQGELLGGLLGLVAGFLLWLLVGVMIVSSAALLFIPSIDERVQRIEQLLGQQKQDSAASE